MPIEKLPPETGLKQQNNTDFEKSLENIKSPRLKETLTRIMNNIKHSAAQEEAEQFKKEIIKKPDRPEQQVFSFLPHQMAKTSIFFPMSDKELKEENRRINKIEHETGWGKIVIEGVKLAIFEEDVFLALLCLAKERYKKSQDAFILTTNINKIIHILYGVNGYSKRNRNVILRTLKHFELVSFDLIVGEWKRKEKEQLRVEKINSIGNIVSSFKYDEETKELIIYFNPHFFAYFLESMLTNINLSIRRRLKKDGSKALLRFLSTHTQPGQMHILTVLNAINFNTNQPMFKLRQLFKSYIKELKGQKILGPKTKIYNDDTVCFDILPPKKTIPV